MPEQTKLPDNHPIMIAWKNYTETNAYKSVFAFASKATQGMSSMWNSYIEATLWGAFVQGYLAASNLKKEDSSTDKP